MYRLNSPPAEKFRSWYLSYAISAYNKSSFTSLEGTCAAHEGLNNEKILKGSEHAERLWVFLT